MIASNYGIKADDIEVTHYSPSNIWETRIEWQTSLGTYWMASKHNGLQMISLFPKKKKATFEQLIDCVEEYPEWYRAFYVTTRSGLKIRLTIELWFPSKGIVAQYTSVVSSPNELPTVTSDFPINFISIVMPGSPENVYERMEPGSGFQHPLEGSWPLRPWPGNWDELWFNGIP